MASNKKPKTSANTKDPFAIELIREKQRHKVFMERLLKELSQYQYDDEASEDKYDILEAYEKIQAKILDDLKIDYYKKALDGVDWATLTNEEKRLKLTALKTEVKKIENDYKDELDNVIAQIEAVIVDDDMEIEDDGFLISDDLKFESVKKEPPPKGPKPVRKLDPEGVKEKAKIFENFMKGSHGNAGQPRGPIDLPEDYKGVADIRESFLPKELEQTKPTPTQAAATKESVQTKKVAPPIDEPKQIVKSNAELSANASSALEPSQFAEGIQRVSDALLKEIEAQEAYEREAAAIAGIGESSTDEDLSVKPPTQQTYYRANLVHPTKQKPIETLVEKPKPQKASISEGPDRDSQKPGRARSKSFSGSMGAEPAVSMLHVLNERLNKALKSEDKRKETAFAMDAYLLRIIEEEHAESDKKMVRDIHRLIYEAKGFSQANVQMTEDEIHSRMNALKSQLSSQYPDDSSKEALLNTVKKILTEVYKEDKKCKIEPPSYTIGFEEKDSKSDILVRISGNKLNGQLHFNNTALLGLENAKGEKPDQEAAREAFKAMQERVEGFLNIGIHHAGKGTDKNPIHLQTGHENDNPPSYETLITAFINLKERAIRENREFVMIVPKELQKQGASKTFKITSDIQLGEFEERFFNLHAERTSHIVRDGKYLKSNKKAAQNVFAHLSVDYSESPAKTLQAYLNQKHANRNYKGVEEILTVSDKKKESTKPRRNSL